MIARSEWKSEQGNADVFTGHSESGHAVKLDASKEHAEGPSPMEAVLMALCSCTSVDVVSILRKKRQSLASLTVSATAEQAPAPPRVFTKIHLTYTVHAEPGQQLSRKAVEDAVELSKHKYCSVSLMLEKAAEITYDIAFPDGEPLP